MNGKLFIKLFFFFFILHAFEVSAQEKDTAQEKAKDTIKTSRSLRRLLLKDSDRISRKYKYNATLDKYVYSEKVGEYDISTPIFLTPQEYENLVIRERMGLYFREKSKAMQPTAQGQTPNNAQRDLLPEFYVKSELFESIFGGNNIDIIPQGNVAFDLGMRYTKNDNPSISPEYRSSYGIDFDQRISLGIQGKVGTRLSINAMYDTQATFDFQNVFKLEYSPNEDDIVRKVELGNVSLPLNSSLITGAQSLFGLKTELQFGRTTITGVFSEQRSQSQTVTAQGGGTMQDFEIRALDYDENRNYFLSQFFRDQYDRALENYPYIRSKVQIVRVEVWATNRSNRTSNIRNIVALQDLGEAKSQNTRIAGNAPAGFFRGSIGDRPTNEANKYDPTRIGSSQSVLTKEIRDVATVRSGFGSMSSLVNEGFDYAILENAQKLEEGRDFKVNKQLGYISLSQRLNNDEILAVAYQYTYEGNVYQVGEFANDGISATTNTYIAGQNKITNNCLVLKMLKSNRLVTGDPIWNLMMKNVYSLNAVQINPENFRMNIFYNDPSPVNYIVPVDEATWNRELTRKILLQLFNFDRLNAYNDPENGGDGFFDFVDGITIDPEYGKIIFTKVEPFGKYLYDKLGGGSQYNDPNAYQPSSTAWNANQKKYVFRSLYTDIKTKALEDAERNKFTLKGRYKSKGGRGISLGAYNVPRGSVRVTVGGRILQEGIDYTVNYQQGTVQIIDPTIENSNLPIQVSVENNLIFGGQSRRFMGVNVEHKFSDKFVVGTSLINMRERPYTQKANYGQEPVNNTIFGFGGSYSTELPFLTRLLNKVPSLQSDVASNLSVRGEMAFLRPSSPSSSDFDGEATAYLDDFEAAQTTVDIRGMRSWSLASTPLRFGQGSYPNQTLYGNAPEDADNLKNGYGRAKLAWYSIDPVFYGNNKPGDVSASEISKNSTRRIYVKEIFPERELAQGDLLVQNTLDLAYYPNVKGSYNNNPQAMSSLSATDKWGGIMRGISATNFEENNIEYIQFWVLDPYTSGEFNPSATGELVFDLGNISEDILKDGRKQYENGLPGLSIQSPTHTTAWGKTPVSQSLLYAFDANTENRALQDIGLDGLTDEQERAIYANNLVDSPTDPAMDNYEYYLSRSGGILSRYYNYNGTQGNSPVSGSNQASTLNPDTEDVNRDNTMSTVNSYYEYRVPIHGNVQRTDRYVSDIKEVYSETPDGQPVFARWIQYKIPIKDANRREYGGGGDLRSVTHIRMYLTGFASELVLRFGTLDLVRGDWRHYTKSLKDDLSAPDAGTSTEIGSVNLIENGTRQPIPYRMPPGVYREQINQNNTIVSQNEQSLSYTVCDLAPRDARGVYKNLNADLRQYKRIKMFVHAERHKNQSLSDGELVAFIRLGSDLSENFYQVELPLRVTPAGVYLAEGIWPSQNSFDIPMEALTQIKAKGINSGNLANLTYYDAALNHIASPATTPHVVGQNRYAIKGNPSLADIQIIMVGVKNVTSNHLCGEVWFNELRMAELENKGGWAGIAAVDLNAADFMDMSVTGKISTVGFGTVEQKPNERSREEVKQLDAMMNINAGKLFPKKWNVQMPIGLNRSSTVATPEYDPQYEDIKLKDRIAAAQTQAQKDLIKEQAEDYTLRRGISLIGVKKNLGEGEKAKVYSIENFTLNYAYNQMDHHDFEIESQREQNVRTGALYAHAFEQKKWTPFKNNQQVSASKYLKWLSEVNFNILPNNIYIGPTITRAFARQRFREVYPLGVNPSSQVPLPELQQRNYLFDWQYGINYSLTKSLKVSYDVTNSNIIRNYYRYNNIGERELNKELTLWHDFWNQGTPNHFMSAFKLNYELPLDKLPFLSFVKASYSYTGDFDWQRGSEALTQVANQQINKIQNANTHNFTANMTFDRFYSSLGVKNKGLGQKSTAKDHLLRFATMIKRIGVSYTETNGSMLPGYLPQIGFFGTSKPSLPFVFGWQDDIRYEAGRRGWLTDFADFNEQFIRSTNKTLNLTASLQPANDLQIDLKADREYIDNFEETFNAIAGYYNPLIGNTTGNFMISDNMILTSFMASDEYSSKAFQKFKDNRLTIARRLAAQRGINLSDPNNLDADGFPKGYGKNNQAVMMPAFYAAYTGRDAEGVSLGAFRTIPIPAWTVRYSGLMRLDSFKNAFRRFSLTHGYRASYALSDFRTNLEYSKNPDQLDQGGNFRNEKLFTNVNLVEQFSPLIRIDAELQNSLSVMGEIRRDRTISISLDNNYLTELMRREYRLGLGYRIKDISFASRFNGRDVIIKSDLNLKADIALRSDFTVIRNMELNDNQVTNGQTSWLGRFTADYSFSKNLSGIFYFDYSFSKYAISTSFPMTTIRTGITVRYTFN
ncbi:cell surface protein SprA [Capnocytophaga gingivalis]|uniref:Cell surface protein SprA n=1 Tax=Capnocytophaga gingivalis TaxID=1017 RepID=A0ABU5ZB43_9FLAO|nr:cell surface protein SprA [Capnocytophaga gingivalis]MEB3076187.1 cell surface protein SprA [Capnocytophaga gingivalis]